MSTAGSSRLREFDWSTASVTLPMIRAAKLGEVTRYALSATYNAADCAPTLLLKPLMNATLRCVQPFPGALEAQLSKVV